jgi:hypothetical protein
MLKSGTSSCLANILAHGTDRLVANVVMVRRGTCAADAIDFCAEAGEAICSSIV